MKELIKQAQDSIYIRIYGTEVFDFQNRDNTDLSDLGHKDGQVKLIQVNAIGYGLSTDSCINVNPYYFMVTGLGKDPECNGAKFPDTVKLWVLRRDAVTARLDTVIGSVEELIEDGFSESDFETLGPVDLKVKPIVTITIRERGNGNICVDYSASVEAYYKLSVIGGKWKKFASTSIGGSECINDNACIKVIDSDYITAKLCYQPGNNRICLEARAGYKGVSVKGTVCHNL
jgi:hypothetical protein